MSEGDPTEVVEDAAGEEVAEPVAQEEEATSEAPAGSEEQPDAPAGEKSYGASEFHDEEEHSGADEGDASKPAEDVPGSHDDQDQHKVAAKPAAPKPGAPAAQKPAPVNKAAPGNKAPAAKPAAPAKAAPAPKKPSNAPAQAKPSAAKSPIAPKPAAAKPTAPPSKPVVAVPAPKPVVTVPSPKPVQSALQTPTSPGRFTFSSAPHNNTAKPMPRETFSHSKYEAMKIAEDNNKLCKKLLEISSGHVRADGLGNHNVESAASVNRRRREDRIAQENLALYKRLQSVKPTTDISRDALDKHYSAQKAYGSNARKFKPLPLTSTKAAAAHSLAPAQQQATQQFIGTADEGPAVEDSHAHEDSHVADDDVAVGA